MILDVFDDTLTLNSIFCRFTEQNYNEFADLAG